ncbi:MAG: AAA family ATPase [Terracidiphilus sp.]
MLLIFGGLPGTGKTTIARALAGQIGAMHLRIDSIEQVIRSWARNAVSLDDVGYRVAYAIAEENLKIGISVLADSVNPIYITRDTWRKVGQRAQTKLYEVEIACSDFAEHRRRVEGRSADISGLELPSWQDVVSRHYETWNSEHLVIETAGKSVKESVEILRKLIGR